MEYFLYNVREKKPRKKPIDTKKLKETYVKMADAIPDADTVSDTIPGKNNDMYQFDLSYDMYDEVYDDQYTENKEYFESLTVKELIEIMKSLDLPYSKMKKCELIDSIMSLDK